MHALTLDLDDLDIFHFIELISQVVLNSSTLISTVIETIEDIFSMKLYIFVTEWKYEICGLSMYVWSPISG